MSGCRPSGRLALFDPAAGLLDGRARAPRGDHGWAFERHLAPDLPRQDHLRALGLARHDARLEQRREVDELGLDLVEVGQRHFGARLAHRRAEADLRQAPLQRDLAALEADLVVAALARLLALAALAAGLALAGRGAAPDAQPLALAARARLHGVESHHRSLLRAQAFSTASRCFAALIMPRTAGVSSTTFVSRMRRSPRPYTEARMFCSCPCTLPLRVTLTLPLLIVISA